MAPAQTRMNQGDELLSRAERLPYEIPTQANRLQEACRQPGSTQEEVLAFARATHAIIHPRAYGLLSCFLRHKQEHGERREREVYGLIDISGFLSRLLTLRPLVFAKSSDEYVLRDGRTRGHGTRGPARFEDIGTIKEQEPLIFTQYQSYEEMELSALLGVSGPTLFVNSGGRTNSGIPAQVGSFEQKGVLVGVVGARFERSKFMEFKHMVVTKEQNTEQNGYGNSSAAENTLMNQWAKFYGLESFPTYEDAVRDRTAGGTRYIEFGETGNLFDSEVYKARCEVTAEMFLAEADGRAAAAGARAYCHIEAVGAGPEVRLHESQTRVLLEAYSTAAKRLVLSHVGLLYFSSFDCGVQSSPLSCGGVQSGGCLPTAGGGTIPIVFGVRDLAEKLPQCGAGELPWLLVAQYEWHSNSYPGNDYWAGALTASSAAAAACCSCVPELQNPDVNPDAFAGVRVQLTPVASAVPASDAPATIYSTTESRPGPVYVAPQAASIQLASLSKPASSKGHTGDAWVQPRFTAVAPKETDIKSDGRDASSASAYLLPTSVDNSSLKPQSKPASSKGHTGDAWVQPRFTTFAPKETIFEDTACAPEAAPFAPEAAPFAPQETTLAPTVENSSLKPQSEPASSKGHTGDAWVTPRFTTFAPKEAIAGTSTPASPQEAGGDRTRAPLRDVSPRTTAHSVAAPQDAGTYRDSWAQHCQGFELPNMAYAVGTIVESAGPMMMREQEDLDSKQVRQMAEGQQFVVRARGVAPSGKRLFVTVVEDSCCQGWISCMSQSGRMLLFPVQETPKPVAGAAPQASPSPPTSPTPVAGAAPSMVDDTSLYPVGSEVIVMNEVLMRGSEETANHDTMPGDGCWLQVGRRLMVIAHGLGVAHGGTGRRLKVQFLPEGDQGWISCKSQSGRELIRLVADASTNSAPAAAAAIPSEVDSLRAELTAAKAEAASLRESANSASIAAASEARPQVYDDRPPAPTSATARATQSSGTDEIAQSDLERYAESLAEILSKGHAEIKLPLVRFIGCQGSALVDDGFVQSKFAPFEFRTYYSSMVEIERLTIDITIRRKGNIHQVSYKAHCCIESRDAKDLPADNLQAASAVAAPPVAPEKCAEVINPSVESASTFIPTSSQHPVAATSQQNTWQHETAHFFQASRAELEQSQQAQQPAEPPPYPGFEPTTGFERVDLQYICVDPDGLRLRNSPIYSKAAKAGGELKAGEVCRICERGVEGGITWLHLADGRGWAFERTNRRRMSQLPRPQNLDGPSMLIDPLGAASCSLELSQTPLRTKGRGGCNALSPGTLVHVVAKVQVLMQSEKSVLKDESVTFFQVDAGNGDVGWLPDGALAHYEDQTPPGNGPSWVSVLPDCNPKVYSAAGIDNKTIVYALSGGDLLEVDLLRKTQGVAFFRVKGEKQWVCSTIPRSNRAAVDIVTIEPHQFLYRCADKAGVYLRETPTWVKGKDPEKNMLKHRAMFIVTDKATFGNGDVFVYVSSPKKGWAPISRRDDKSVAIVSIRPATELELGQFKSDGKGMPFGKSNGKGTPCGKSNGKGMPLSSPGAYGLAPSQGPSPGAFGHTPSYGHTPSQGPAFGHAPSYGHMPSQGPLFGHAPSYGQMPSQGPSPGAFGHTPSYAHTPSQGPAFGHAPSYGHTPSQCPPPAVSGHAPNQNPQLGAFGPAPSYGHAPSQGPPPGSYGHQPSQGPSPGTFGHAPSYGHVPSQSPAPGAFGHTPSQGQANYGQSPSDRPPPGTYGHQTGQGSAPGAFGLAPSQGQSPGAHNHVSNQVSSPAYGSKGQAPPSDFGVGVPSNGPSQPQQFAQQQSTLQNGPPQGSTSGPTWGQSSQWRPQPQPSGSFGI